jgi:hydroxymethylpyrimidine/phosphomethylpyrimidine kinase
MSAITAVTAQNTLGVTAIHPVPVSMIDAQIKAVLDDIGVDGIKIGMLYSQEVVEHVGHVLSRCECKVIILDPVMIATSGDALVRGDVAETMKNTLFPVVRLLTPNVPEAEHLLGCTISSDLADAARQMAGEFCLSVLVKAGHTQGEELVDVLYDYDTGTLTTFANSRIHTENVHGTGCTLSSAITSFAARGMALPDAVRRAEDYVNKAIRSGALYRLGRGHGPVHHFHAFW